METTKRNVNLDVLRVFATLGVITLHLVGGVDTLPLNQSNRIITNILLALTYTSVNLFGLLSGYLKVDRPHHNASIIRIVLQTAFWCFLITAICFIVAGQKSVTNIINNAFPFIGDRLWYITCYLFVFLCAPFLNLLVEKLSKSCYRKLLIIFAVLMSVVTTVCVRDLFHVVNNGYSAGWLVFMYLLGGYFKKHGFDNISSRPKAIVLLIVSLCLIVTSKYVIEIIAPKISLSGSKAWLLYYYSSPLTLLNSICVFYLFANGNWKGNCFGKVMTWLSNVSLGVYIIHSHPYSLDYILIGENLTWTVKDNPLITFLIIIGTIIGIYFGLGVLEWIRMKLFRVCGIDGWTKKMGEKLDRVLATERRE